MKFKFNRIITFLFLFILPVFLVSCSEEENFDGKTKVVFELEGGIYQNCKSTITHYYDFEENTNNLIKEPTKLSNAEITKSGYNLEGWYTEKNVVSGNTTYSNKWDFETDKVTNEGITLYAKWDKNIKYTYNVCYYDENNELVSLGTYEVSEGEKFEDYSRLAKKRIGYTKLAFKDINGNVWDDDFEHPGGDNDLEIKVVVEYIKGNFEIVSTAEELLSSVGDNIYLLNDIDLEGRDLDFANYNKTFIGNNHTISNFNLSYQCSRADLIDDFEELGKKSLCISLFGNTNGAKISDVNFENVTVNVKTTLSLTYKIYVAPLSVSMKNTNISNVSFTGSFGYTDLPANFDVENNLVFITDKAYHITDEASVISNVTINVTNN